MKQIILSIKPKFAEAILQGEKRCEFRKSSFPKDVRFAVIYSTMPVGKIVGWFIVKRCRTAKPDKLWRIHKKDGGINREEFDVYYSSCDSGVCLEIRYAQRLEEPIDPFEIFNRFVVPQSFRYLKREECLFLSDLIGNKLCPNQD